MERREILTETKSPSWIPEHIDRWSEGSRAEEEEG